MKKIKVAVCGASGYTGRELLLRLLRHSGAEVVGLAHGPSSEDCLMPDLFPEFKTLCELPVLGVETLLSRDDLDCVFLALPHGASAPIAKEFLARGVRVVDFSADYRLRDVATYEKWYKVSHCDTENLKEAVYGLSEWYRDKIKEARVVAVPGARNSEVLPNVMPCKDGEQFYNVYIKPALDSGKLMQADTLDELADKLGFEGEFKENFLKSVERYKIGRAHV